MSSSCRKARRYERAELRARVDADLGAGIFFYVLLDGFDLGVGVGMLYNFMPDTRSRNS